jgi:hypothetical protein
MYAGFISAATLHKKPYRIGLGLYRTSENSFKANFRESPECELRTDGVLRSSGEFQKPLSFHPLDPLSSPLRRFERLGVVAGVAPNLAVFEFEDYRSMLDTRPPP